MLKRTPTIIPLLVLMQVCSLHAQNISLNLLREKQPRSALAIMAGYMNPKDTEGGMMLGASYGLSVDEAVNLGMGIDLFHKTYDQKAEVASIDEPGLTSQIDTLQIEYSRTIIPLMLVVDIKMPAKRLFPERQLYFGYFVHAGLGYEFLISKEKNYDPEINTEQSRSFGGLGWRVGGGVFYDVGSRSTLSAAVIYNNSEVSRGIKESNKGLPISERVNLSGLGFRVGLHMKFY
jgi:hypothetical protein